MIKLNKIFSSKGDSKPLLFLTAMRKESEILFRGNTFQEKIRSERTRLYQLQDHPIYLLETGIGIKDSKKTLRQIIQEVNPGVSVNLGICGALDPQIKIYDAYLIDDVHYPGKKFLSLSENLNRIFVSTNFPLKLNNLLTLKKPLLNKLEKLAEKLRIPILLIKVVSDALEGEVKELVYGNSEKWQAKLESTLEVILTAGIDKIFY
ncbi:MAG: hypothetical protein P8048_06760 [Calditrichia bacterium]